MEHTCTELCSVKSKKEGVLMAWRSPNSICAKTAAPSPKLADTSKAAQATQAIGRPHRTFVENYVQTGGRFIKKRDQRGEKVRGTELEEEKI